METKLELREKEIVKEAKKQELEQSIWRSIERDAKLMGTKSLLDAAETEEEGGAESGQGQKTEISKRSQRVCPFPQAENETNFHFYFGDEWRKTKWNHLVVRYMNQAHISGDLSNAVIEAYIWERDPTQFVAYRRFTYDETTKLGFGLSQRKRSALQAKGSSSSKVKASEFRKSLPSKKITAFKGKCRRSSKSRDEEFLPFKRARGYSPPVDAATAKSPSFLFLLSIAAVAGPRVPFICIVSLLLKFRLLVVTTTQTLPNAGVHAGVTGPILDSFVNRVIFGATCTAARRVS
ncbi:hypothetical protein GG344DRAFT_70854 [Lentinula edodes]|nr:hypothetical protein GG344DRAFT_70854 [Lentinula edodes]